MPSDYDNWKTWYPETFDDDDPRLNPPDALDIADTLADRDFEKNGYH